MASFAEKLVAEYRRSHGTYDGAWKCAIETILSLKSALPAKKAKAAKSGLVRLARLAHRAENVVEGSARETSLSCGENRTGEPSCLPDLSTEEVSADTLADCGTEHASQADDTLESVRFSPRGGAIKVQWSCRLATGTVVPIIKESFTRDTTLGALNEKSRMMQEALKTHLPGATITASTKFD